MKFNTEIQSKFMNFSEVNSIVNKPNNYLGFLFGTALIPIIITGHILWTPDIFLLQKFNQLTHKKQNQIAP